MTSSPPPVRVFISYSHDSPAHAKRVLDLAQRLRGDGIDAWIDQFELAPPEGWPRWMIQQIKRADHILLICTETYRRRFEGEEKPGKGRGANWEGLLMQNIFYRDSGRTSQLIPVLWDGGDDADIPLELQGHTYHLLDSGYPGLLARLRNIRATTPAALGSAATTPAPTSPPKLARQERRSAGLPEPDPAQCPFIAGSPITESAHFFGREQQLRQIRSLFAQGRQPIQLLGERRMGKTSLLHQVKHLIPSDAQANQLVWLDVSPVRDTRRFVERIAHERGHRSVMKLLDDDTSNVSEPQLIDAFTDLLPLTLLLDEADALTEPDRHFGEDFLLSCRSHCQEGRLHWISASRRDLIDGNSNLSTSPFMNDSLKIWVGALSAEASSHLLEPLAPKDATWVAAHAGGQAYVLQWLARQLWLGQPIGEPLADEAADELHKVFRNWWSHCNGAEHKVLLSCTDGAKVKAMSDRSRRLARRLARRGLLLEEGTVAEFTIPGRLWRGFVVERASEDG